MSEQRTGQISGKIAESAKFLRERLSAAGLQPEIGCILGSGLGALADQVEQAMRIPFADIPHFPESKVAGHAGQCVFGFLEGKQVMMLQGRFHYYEGYSMKTVALPVYLMSALGIHSLIVTNAAGGMNHSYKAGDLMVISDHLNMTGDSPLIGPNDETLGVRFPDMSAAYDREYGALAMQLVADSFEPGAVAVHRGVYAGISGPAYMTSAELTMLARCGADALGMSTVPEVLAARHCGLRVLGISCITDMAIGEELEPLTHEQVMAVAKRSRPVFSELVRLCLRHM